jgi:glucose-1-phosphate thymidylyltransferase
MPKGHKNGNNMDALILCGGFAKRLEPITEFIPKMLLPVNGKPLLDYIISDVSSLGVDNIIISTNQKFLPQFEYFIELRKRAGLIKEIVLISEPTFSNEEKFGAVRGITYAIEQAGVNSDLLIIAGDNFYNFSLKNMLEHFKGNKKPTIALYNIKSIYDAKRFGVVKLEGARITEFEEKPNEPKSTLVSTGIYLYPKEVLSKFKKYIDDRNNPDAPGYFLQWLLKDTEVDGIVYHDDWFDIGTIDTYRELFNKFNKPSED